MISEAKLMNIGSSPLQFFHHSTMTVTEKVILNKKLKTGLTYVNSPNDNDEVGGKKRLICRLRIAPKSHPTITGSDNSLQVGNDAYSLPDSGKQQLLGTDIQQASSGRKRKPSIENEKHLCKDKSVNTLRALVSKKSGCVDCFSEAKKSACIEKQDHCDVKAPEVLDASKTKQCAGILRKLMSHKFGWVFDQPVDPVKLNIPDYFSIITKPMDLGTIKQNLGSKSYTKASQFADDVRLTFTNAMRYNPPSNDVHIMAKILSNIFSSSWKVLEAKWNEEVHTLQDNTDEQASNLRSTHPKCASFPDSHYKKHSVPAENQHKKDAKKRRAGMQLHTDAHSEKSLDRSHASLEATCHVVSNSVPESGDAGIGPAGKSGDENCQPCISTPLTFTKSGDMGPLAEDQLSPSRALRAAMLKSRFADTILKAQQKKIVNLGEKEDLEKTKRERQRLEKLQQKERLRIEAEMKAAEEAMRTKQAELKMQREKEREAARLALQQMEKTVDIDENYELLKDLESFGYAEPTKLPGDTMLLGPLGNPLERLGLFMKDDYLDEEDDVIVSAVAQADKEDGEIVSKRKL